MSYLKNVFVHYESRGHQYTCHNDVFLHKNDVLLKNIIKFADCKDKLHYSFKSLFLYEKDFVFIIECNVDVWHHGL